MELTFRKLRIWNLCVGLFQMATAAIIFAITDYDLTAPWYTFFIRNRDPDVRAGFYIPEVEKQASVPIGVFSGIFLALSGIDHLATTLPGLNRLYNSQLCRNRNAFRWIEYSLSASLMRVQIAMLSGWVDLHLLYAIFGLTACTMLFGWLMEKMNGDRLATYELGHDTRSAPKPTDTELGSEQYSNVHTRRVDWSPLLLGFVPHLFAWSIVACGFFQGVTNGDPPGFVWAIIFILFFLDLCFAIVQFLQFKQAKGFRGFAHAEFAYIILSLTAKQLLAWIEFGGAQSLKPEN